METSATQRRALTLVSLTLLLATALQLLPSEAKAASVWDFTGFGDGTSWSDRNNWSGGGSWPPSAGDTFRFTQIDDRSSVNDLPASSTDNATIVMQDFGEGPVTQTISGNPIAASSITLQPDQTLVLSTGVSGTGQVNAQLEGNSRLEVNGALSRSMRAMHSGAGTASLSLGGNEPNAGDLEINAGINAEFRKPAGVDVGRRVFIWGSTATWYASEQIGNTRFIELADDGTADLNGFDETVDWISAGCAFVCGPSGRVTSGTGTLTINDFSNSTAGTDLEIAGNLRIPTDGTYHELYVWNSELNISARMTGDQEFDLVADGGSLVTLADACSYTGTMNLYGDGNGTVTATTGFGGTVNVDRSWSNVSYVDGSNGACVRATLPQEPQNLTATPGDGVVDLAWEPPADAGSAPVDSYNIYRRVWTPTEPHEPTELVGTSAEPMFTDNGVVNGTAYEYYVTAVTSVGEGPQSPWVEATPRPNPVPPQPPGDLVAKSGESAARLTWHEPADLGTDPLDGYEVYRSTTEGELGTLVGTTSATTREYVDGTLENGTTYYFTVKAVSAAGSSEPSQPAVAEPAAGAGLTITMWPETEPIAGQDVALNLVVGNGMTEMIPGKVTINAILPPGLSVVSSGGSGWSCTSRTVGPSVLASCESSADIPALADLDPAVLTVRLPATWANATSLFNLSASTPSHTAVSKVPLALDIARRQRAHLSISAQTAAALGAEPQDVTMPLVNDGAGPTIEPVVVTLPLPAGVQAVGGAAPEGWACEPSSAEVVCTSSQPMLSKAGASLVVALTADTTASAVPITLSPVATSRDAFGPISSAATAAVEGPQESSAVVSVVGNVLEDGDDAGATQYVLTNDGTVHASGETKLEQTLPEGMGVVVVTNPDGWSCDRDGRTFTCVHPTLELAAGGSATGPTVVFKPLQGATFLPNTHFSEVVIATYGGLASPPSPVDVATPEAATGPTASTGLSLKDSPLYGGLSSSATLTLEADPSAGPGAPRTFAALFPPQLQLDGAGVVVAPSGFPEGTEAPSCQVRTGTFGAGFGSALVCVGAAELPVGSRIDVTVPFVAADELGGAVTFVSGLIATDPTASVTDRTLAAWTRIARGPSAFELLNEVRTATADFRADAGPHQRRDAAVPAADGTQTPTEVVLDASATPSIGRAVSFGWVQTAGPAVSFVAQPGAVPAEAGVGGNPAFPAGTTFESNSGVLSTPQAFGQKVRFVAPQVSDTVDLEFRLWVTDGVNTRTALTTVRIDPLADAPPSVTKVTLTDATTGATLDPAQTPAAGDVIRVAYETTDPEGDPVTVVPKIAVPTELGGTAFTPEVTTPGAPTSTFTFTWPTAVPKVAIVATLTDGHLAPPAPRPDGTLGAPVAVASKHSLVIGPDPAPLGITLSSPDTALTPGSTFTITADLTNGSVDGATTTIDWAQLTGPVGTLTPQPDTLSATYKIPATARPGTTIQIQATGLRGTGSAASLATATTTLVISAPPELALSPIRKVSVSARTTADPPSVSVAQGTTQIEGVPVSSKVVLAVDPSGGTAPYTFSWLVVSGGGSLTTTNTQQVEYAAPATEGLVTIRATVKDASGASVSQIVSVSVGGPAEATPGAEPCAFGGMLKTIYDEAKNRAGSERIAVSFGSFDIDLGTIDNLLANNPVCSSNVLLNIRGGSAHYAGIGFSNLNGTLTKDAITIESARIELPSSWHLDQVLLQDVKFDFTKFKLTGSLITHSALPMLSTPTSLSSVTTKLTFKDDVLSVQANAGISGGIVAVSGAYCMADKACPTNITDIPNPLGSKKFAVHVVAQDVMLFGKPLTGKGDLTNNGGTVTGSVDLTWGAGVQPEDGTLDVSDVHLIWNKDKLALKAKAAFGGKFAAQLDGTYVDSKNWSLNVSGGLSQNWTVAGGLVLQKYDPVAGTGTGVTGTVSSKAGTIAYNVKLRVGGAWDVGPVTVRDIAVKLSSGGDAPAGCAFTEAEKSKMFVQVTGVADISWQGARRVTVNVDACIVPDVRWVITTTAAMSNVSIIDGFDLTGVSFTAANDSVAHRSSYVLSASATVLGVRGAVTVALIAPDEGDNAFLADVFVNMKDLGVPIQSNGHLLYTSKPIADLGTVPGLKLDLGSDAGGTSPPAARTTTAAKATDVSTPIKPVNAAPTADTATASSCASGTVTGGNPLSGIPLPKGFTALTSFSAPEDVCGFLKDKLGLPVSPRLVVTVSLGSPMVITASLTLGDMGFEILHTDGGTILSLKRISLTISTGGSFGLSAAADLTLPAMEEGQPAPPPMSLVAAITIKLGPPSSLTVSLSKTGAAWENAFGIDGLKLGDIAIQGGIVFSTPPTPTIGFAAQVLDLPSDWKSFMGIVPTNPDGSGMEPVELGLNISVASPVLAIKLGVKGGQDFMRPLQPISSTLGQALRIDYAELVIAPNGGDIGSFHYDPGFHLGFAAKILGVDLDVRADIDFAAGEIKAHMDLGAFAVGGLSLDRTLLDFELSRANMGMSFAFTGGFGVGDAHAAATIKVEARMKDLTTPSIFFDFKADLTNFTIPVIGGFESLKLRAHGDLTDTSAGLGKLQIAARGDLVILGARVTAFGNIVFSTYGISSGDLAVAAAPISLGPVTLGGHGCDSSLVRGAPADLLPLPTNGPCFQIGLHPGTPDPFYIQANAALDVAGVEARLDARVDGKGLAIKEASLQLGNLANARLYNSRLYWGNNLAGTFDKNANGQWVQVRPGDFTLRGSASVNLLSVFTTNVLFDFGSIGGSQWANGYARVGILDSPSFPIHASVELKGQFSRTWNPSTLRYVTHYAFSGGGGIMLGGSRTYLGTWTGGYKLVDGRFSLANDSHFGVPAGFKLAAQANIGPVHAGVSAQIASTSRGITFDLAGNGHVDIIGSGFGAYVRFWNTDGPLKIEARFNVDIGPLHAQGNVYFDTKGGLCVGGSAGISGGSMSFLRGEASFCTARIGGQMPGVHAHFNAFNLIDIWADFEAWNRFAAGGFAQLPGGNIDLTVCAWGACAGLRGGVSAWAAFSVATYSTTVTLPNGQRVNVSPGASFWGEARLWGEICWVFSCDGGSLAVRVQTNPTRFCGRLLGYGVCYQPWTKVYRW